MSFTWLIDGYNLMGALGLIQGNLGPSGLEKGRLYLLDFLARQFGDQAGEVLVVFDAARAPRGVPAEMEHKGIQVRFAKGMDEADDLIEELLRAQPHPSRLTLVSSDHRLRRAAELSRKRVLECQAFLDELEGRKKVKEAGQGSEIDNVKPQKPSAAERDHWLSIFSDVEKAAETRELFDDYGLGKPDQGPKD